MNILQDKFIRYLLVIVLAVLALFLLTQTLLTYQQYRFVGAGVSASNTISMTGKGEVTVKPDIASFSVTVKEKDKDQAKAQSKATDKVNKITKYLKEQGVAEKDIKTTSFNLSPEYYWNNNKRKQDGYVASQTITVKVRDIEKAGKLLAQMSALGASRVGSLSFKIDNPDSLKAKARAMAIKDAKEKAKALAKQLGVDIIRVVGFSESSYDRPQPIYMARSMKLDAAMDEGTSVPEPDIPTGENKITSTVTVRFEIR